MTKTEIEQYVADVQAMSNEELERELSNLIEWEGYNGTSEPRIDEITMELLLRELMVDPDWIVGTEIDENLCDFADVREVEHEKEER